MPVSLASSDKFTSLPSLVSKVAGTELRLSPTDNVEPVAAALATIAGFLALVALVLLCLRLGAIMVLKVLLGNVGEVDDLRATLRAWVPCTPKEGLERVMGAVIMIDFTKCLEIGETVGGSSPLNMLEKSVIPTMYYLLKISKFYLESKSKKDINLITNSSNEVTVTTL
jgi:hypothetical protein